MAKRRLILKAAGDLFDELSRLDFGKLNVQVQRDDSDDFNWILLDASGDPIDEDKVDLRDWMEHDVLVEACRDALNPKPSRKRRTGDSCPGCGMPSGLEELFG